MDSEGSGPTARLQVMSSLLVGQDRRGGVVEGGHGCAIAWGCQLSFSLLPLPTTLSTLGGAP